MHGAQQNQALEDVQERARSVVDGSFTLLDKADPMVASMHDIAVERLSRSLLSKPTGAKKANAPISFQTQHPGPINVKRLMAAGQKIGTLPMIFHKLVEVVNSPRASVEDLSKIISTDPALCAKLLRLVNSPLYGLPTRIDTIPRAVILVGTGQLVMMAMGTTLLSAFSGIPLSIINMQSFWSHSLACGAASRLIAKHSDCEQPDGFFVAGLLHDISRLLVYSELPNHALHLVMEARRRNVTMHSLEKEILGFTHEELGADLLLAWSCPDDLVERVRTHHSAEEDGPVDSLVLPAANMLSQAFGFGSSGESYITPLSPGVWGKLRLTPADMPELCRQMDDSVRELRTVLMDGAD